MNIKNTLKDNQENINITTSNIIKDSNNTMRDNIGFADQFDGNVNSIDVNTQDSTSQHSFKTYESIDSSDSTENNFNLAHSSNNHIPLSAKDGTVTQRTKKLLKQFSSVNTMKEANNFRQQAHPLLYELDNLITNQTDQIKKYHTQLNFETKQRLGQGGLTRFFKNNQEKNLIAKIEESKKYVNHYKKLMWHVSNSTRKYPINETEKQQLIYELNLNIKELNLQKKEAGFEFRRLQAKLQDENKSNSSDNSSNKSSQSNHSLITHNTNNQTTQSTNKDTFNVFSLIDDGTGKNKGLFNFSDQGIFSIDDIDTVINNFFSSSTSKDSNSKNNQPVDKTDSNLNKNSSKESEGTLSKEVAISAAKKEELDIEIDQQIIKCERNIIFLERFK